MTPLRKTDTKRQLSSRGIAVLLIGLATVLTCVVAGMFLPQETQPTDAGSLGAPRVQEEGISLAHESETVGQAVYPSTKYLTSVRMLLNGKKHNLLKTARTIDVSAKNTTFSIEVSLRGIQAKRFTIFQNPSSWKVIASASADACTAPIPYTAFTPNLPVYISLTDKSGKVVEVTRLLLTVEDSSKNPVPASFNLGDNIEIRFGSPLDSMAIKVPRMTNIPVHASVDADGNVQAGINVDVPGLLKHDPSWIHKFATNADVSKLIKDARYKRFLDASGFGSANRKNDLVFEIAAFVKGNVISSEYYGTFAIKMGWKGSHEHQLFLGPIPIVLETSGKLTGEPSFTARIVKKNGQLTLRNTVVRITLEGGVGLYAGAGVAFTGSLGVAGGGTITAKGLLAPVMGWEQVDATLRAAIRLQLVMNNYDLEFYNGHYNLYRHDYSNLQRLGVSPPMALRAALQRPPVTESPRSLPALRATSDTQGMPMPSRISETAVPNSSVCLTPVGDDGRMVIFASNEGNEPQRLMWSRRDGDEGAWSEPQPVWDDDTADFYPQACPSDDGGVYLVWSNMRDAASGETTHDVAANSDIAYARFDPQTNQFCDMQFVTDRNDIYEANARIGASNGSPLVVWQENSLDDIVGIGGSHNIMVATPGSTPDAAWPAASVGTANGTVTSLCASKHDSIARVALTVDGDASTETMDDVALYEWRQDSGMMEMRSGKIWNALYATQDGTEILTWGEDECLRCAESDDPIIEELPYASYAIAGDLATDATVAYLWNSDAGNLIGRTHDENGWSDEVSLTVQDQRMSAWDIMSQDGDLAVAYASSPVEDEMPAACGLYASGGTVPMVETVSAEYDGENLNLTVENTGSADIDTLCVIAKENGEERLRQNVAASVALGEQAVLSVPVDMPTDGLAHTYDVSVLPCRSDVQAVPVTISEPVMEMEVTHLVEGELQSHEAIEVTVTNTGTAASDAGKVVFEHCDSYKQQDPYYQSEAAISGGWGYNPEDDLIAELPLPALGVGESHTVRCDADEEKGFFDCYPLYGQAVSVQLQDTGYTGPSATEIVPAWPYGKDRMAFDSGVPGNDDFFTDVTSSTPHYDDIIWLRVTDITSGFPDSTFRPYNPVARCDMAAFLFRIARNWGIVDDSWQATEAQKQVFCDIDESTPHAREVWWLASCGISTGWDVHGGKKEFRPYTNVKRQDMAAFLFRLAKKAGLSNASDSWTAGDYYKKYFCDVSATSTSNHHDEVWWLCTYGISYGWNRPDGKHEFRGLEDVARCDMAAFLARTEQVYRRYSRS